MSLTPPTLACSTARCGVSRYCPVLAQLSLVQLLRTGGCKDCVSGFLPHDESHRASRLAVTPVLRESTDGLLAARLGGWKVRMTAFFYGTTGRRTHLSAS